MLRKTVAKIRRNLNGMSADEFLRVHATIGLATNTIGMKEKRPLDDAYFPSTCTTGARSERLAGGELGAEVCPTVGGRSCDEAVV